MSNTCSSVRLSVGEVERGGGHPGGGGGRGGPGQRRRRRAGPGSGAAPSSPGTAVQWLTARTYQYARRASYSAFGRAGQTYQNQPHKRRPLKFLFSNFLKEKYSNPHPQKKILEKSPLRILPISIKKSTVELTVFMQINFQMITRSKRPPFDYYYGNLYLQKSYLPRIKSLFFMGKCNLLPPKTFVKNKKTNQA